jgi:hypothetical protein
MVHNLLKPKKKNELKKPRYFSVPLNICKNNFPIHGQF